MADEMSSQSPEIDPARAPIVELFRGRYEIGARLPWNGLALCYGARAGTREVAVAVLPVDCGEDSDLARALAMRTAEVEALRTPGVVPFTDAGVLHGVPFVEMERVPGRTLAEVLEDGPLGREQAVHVVRQILGALERGHAHGLVHLDLTPSNVLLDTTEHGTRVRLLGLGLAPLIRGAGLNDRTGPTGKGSGPKAVRYLAGEVVTHAKADTRADVYSAGALLVRAATGELPPRQGAPPTSVGDPALDEIVQQAMAMDPADRFESPGAMGIALEAALEGRPPSRRFRVQSPRDSDGPSPPIPLGAPSASVTPAGTRHARRGMWIGLGALALLAVGLGLVLMMQRPRAATRTTAVRPPARAPRLAVPAPPAGATTYGPHASSTAHPVPPKAAGVEAAAPSPLGASLPEPLARTEARLAHGPAVTAADLPALYRWAHAHRDDPRGHLVLAHVFVHLGWSSDAVERYRTAWRADPGARRDPEMLTDLVLLASRETPGPSASHLLIEVYGNAAVDAIDRALAKGDVPRVDQRRLTQLRARLAQAPAPLARSSGGAM